MQQTEIGRSVTLVRYEPGDNNQHGKTVEYPAIVLGAHRVNNSPFPHFDLAFLDPKRSVVLNGVDWRDAFDRHFSVPHETEIENESFYYRFDAEDMQASKDRLQETVHGLEMQLAAAHQKYAQTTEGKDESLQQLADANAAQPSAEDLDAVAAEEKAKEATAAQQ